MSAVLAWRPFIDPIDAHSVWFLLLLPIALLVSLAWKAVRVHDLRTLPRHVGVMSVLVVGGMIGLGVAAYVGIIWVLPILADLSR
ncbi:MAG: hypothetical protein AAFX79_12970 [Planctomycetota bacterium]